MVEECTAVSLSCWGISLSFHGTGGTETSAPVSTRDVKGSNLELGGLVSSRGEPCYFGVEPR